MKKSYIDKATEYAEEYGIIEFQVKGKNLVYYRSYYSYYEKRKFTTKFVVNLDTMETTKTPLKRWNKLGDWSM